MPPNITQIKIPGYKYQTGRSKPVDQITFHHIVGDAGAAIARFRDSTDVVSSTYIIGSNGRIYQCVAESDTSYADANFDSNSRAITIEHAGGNPSTPYTEAMYNASAELCAWIMSRYNITRFMRHRDVSNVPTACPGALDVERIINQAEGDDMALIGDTTAERSRFTKSHLQIRGREDGAGVFEQVALGHDWQHVLEVLEDDKEADIHFEDAKLGKQAREENWAGQIVAGGGSIDQGTKDDIGIIKSTVLWIKDKLSAIFK